MSWEPNKEWIENSNVYKYMQEKGFEKLDDFISFTYMNPEGFWEDFVKLIGLKFNKPYSKVLDLSRGKQWPKWFIDGKLNIGEQIPDSHEVFVKWMNESDNKKEITYHEVLEESKSVASWLHKMGLKKGDRVAIYLPMIPEMIPIFLGIIRAGMIVVPLFSGFGKEPIRIRLEDSQSKVIFASDVSFRKGKEINMFENISEFNVEKVIVNRSGKKIEGVYDYKSDVAKSSGDYVEPTDTEDPLMIIYTSGTTGKPKGCVHTHDGFPIKAAADIYFQFDMKRGETLMWLTDMGWMMGPWMVFGSLLLKGKIGMIEGYIDLNTLIKFTEDLGVDILGFSASLIRLLRKESPKPPSLKVRVAGNTGEPIDYDSWVWVRDAINGPIINYSGGTEISGGILGNYVIKKIKASSFNGFSPGIEASIYTEDGAPAPPNTEGELVVLSVWPGMTRGFWNDPQRYIETYWSRWKDVWVHGDLAMYDDEGYYYIVGRSDDTIKVAGKRIGPAEIESVINSYPGIVESACVGVPDPVKGERVICFAVPKEGMSESERVKLQSYVEDKLGKALAPSDIIFVSDLPKTRNAKIMRRLIRAVILNKPLGDISALENPQALEEIKKKLTR